MGSGVICLVIEFVSDIVHTNIITKFDDDPMKFHRLRGRRPHHVNVLTNAPSFDGRKKVDAIRHCKSILYMAPTIAEGFLQTFRSNASNELDIK